MSDDKPILPGSLARDSAIDSWLAINPDDTVTVRTGKVEIGQGITTAVAMIAAEELDVDLARINVVSGATGEVVDEKVTSGSGSMEETGRAIRQVAAEARAVLLSHAAEQLQVPLEGLSVEDGTIRSPATNRQVTYWELMAGRPFDAHATGAANPKSPSDYKIVGQNIPQRDARAKVTGAPIFVHDLAFDGLLHACIARPPSYDARLDVLDEAALSQLPSDVKVVRDGNFLGVIASSEWEAIKARDTVAGAAKWSEPATLPDEDAIHAWLLENETAALPVIDGTTQDIPAPERSDPPANAAQTLEAFYAKPYIMHASIGPSAAVALYQNDRLTVWSPSQGPYPLRTCIAASLGWPEDAVTVIHTQGSGCYGHNGADDVSYDAALMALEVPGRPVRVQWTRADEHAWEPYNPAQAVSMRASLDARGTIIDWNLDLWSTTHQGRPRPATADHSCLVADWHKTPARPFPPHKPLIGKESGAHRNARAYYDFSDQRVVSHFVAAQPLRTSSLRGLGNFANILAIECFMDELAEAASEDPLAFRLRHLSDPRGRDVLTAAAEAIGWAPQSPGAGTALGLAFNRYKNMKGYAAVACEVSADKATGEFRVHRAVVAGDAGQIVNRAALSNQLEGGFLQALSWLRERVRFDPVRVTSRDWETYPIMRLPETPDIRTVLVDRPGEPYLGAGEASQGPAGAAIANALSTALGKRLREAPFTPDRVRKMLSER